MTSTKFSPAYSTLMVTCTVRERLVSFGEPDNFRAARLRNFYCSYGLLQSGHHGGARGRPADETAKRARRRS
jgi:hypothetical protein